MNAEEKKKQVAEAALDFVVPNTIIGVGTGSTANYFIDALATVKHTIEGAVASSKVTAERLEKHGIPIFDLNTVTKLSVYIDGADEVNNNMSMIKGGGGALTREKIVASVSEQFICIADDSKLVDTLGSFPLPVEVIPMARCSVSRQLTALGGEPVWREDFVTDNGNIILDLHGLQITNPIALEHEINQIVGVVTNGLFAQRGANVVLLGSDEGVRRLK